MKLFRTNKMSFEGLKLSIMLYRLDKGNIRNLYNITVFAKTILFDLMIDASFLLVTCLGAAHYVFQNDRWSAWLACGVGVYGLNLLNEIVHQYYYQNTELSAEEKVQGILHNAPKYMFFNDREKEIFYKSLYKKVKEFSQLHMVEIDMAISLPFAEVFMQMSYMMYKCCGYCTLQELFL